MEGHLQTPSTTTATTTNPYNDDIIDSTHSSTCSTPYVSAPSSPGRACSSHFSYYYSAPASPMHYLLSTSSSSTLPISSQQKTPFPSDDFDFQGYTAPMTSADELFSNGQIKPIKLSTHLQRPQILAPLIDEDEEFDEETKNTVTDRGRDIKLRSKSLRRTRSMSPLRSTPSFEEIVVHNEEIVIDDNNEESEKETETTPSGNSSRSSSVGRSSKRWVLLKEFLYRSKSEGRNNGQKFWNNLSFSPVLKDKQKLEKVQKNEEKVKISKGNNNGGLEEVKKKRVNGVMGKRRMGMPSAHEMHYTANRAQAEEMRKKTFLPYRQGLLGCLGFNSRSYGAWNGFARAFNPVSST